MLGTKFLVYSCLKCHAVIVVKMDFLEFNKECCLEFKNHKLLKMFNDENEARNFMKQFERDDE